MSRKPHLPSEYEVIYRPWITRNGKRIFRPGGGMWPIKVRRVR